MKNLVPKIIIENYNKNILTNEIDSTTMFIDISGFTEMTENLMKNGNEGAEILTEIINEIFTPSIEKIYQYNGFVSTFAGDAFTAIFPRTNANPDSVLVSAKEIQNIFKDIGTQKTKFGTYNLEVKIGLSFGKVLWKIIPSEIIIGYYFMGKVIYRAANCEAQCKAGEIIVDEFLKKKSKQSKFSKNGNNYLLNSVPQISPNKIITKEVKNSDLTPFISDPIIELKSKGEFRNVISCFISFEERGNFDKKIAEILNLTYQYGGYLNKIDFGDKGAIILVLFGAPIAKEKIHIRACDFVLAVNKIKNFKTKIGLTYYTAFAGFVGSKIRNEYTALGMSVNLAARFMIYANWNQILIDRYIYREIKELYEIEILKEAKLKGFKLKIQTYQLNEKKEDVKEDKFSGKLIGRDKELQKLKKFLNPLHKNKFAGIVYVDGIAGIGKSKLVYELKDSLRRQDYNWFYFPCDEILHKSFNPIIFFLKSYFNQSEKQTQPKNRREFEKKLDWLLQQIDDDKLKKELISSKSLIGALLNFHWKNSLYEKLDKKNRFENTLFALRNLVIATTLRKPVIVELEDGHWIDSDTKKWLKILTRNAENYPFLIITTCRFNVDGSPFEFDLKGIFEDRINLQFLSKKGSENLIKSKLGAKSVPEETISFIFEKSEGNPFYIEQIVLYLMEQKILNRQLKLSKSAINIPTSISEIIMARIDKLTSELKEIVKTACVMGQEFTIDVLFEMLNNFLPVSQEKLVKLIKDVKDEHIWDSVSQIKYLFNHAMIRDSIYGMQLKKRLRELHEFAAKAIEKIHKKELKNYYADLAYNYEKAEIRNKTLEYLTKAGNYAKEMYQNQDAIKYFNKLLNILSIKKKAEHKLAEEIILSKIELLSLIGKMSEVKSELEKLDEMFFLDIEQKDRYFYFSAKYFLDIEDYSDLKKVSEKIIHKIKNIKYKYHIEILHSRALKYLNYQEEFEKSAYKLLKKFREKNELEFESRISNIIGIFKREQAKYEEALEYFNNYYQISKKLDNTVNIIGALHNIGTVNSRLGNKDKAKNNFEHALEFAEKMGNKHECAKLIPELAAILSSQGQNEKALEYYREGLELAKDIGNKIQEQLILYNIAQNYYWQQKYEDALSFLDKCKKICEEISYTRGLDFANDLFGDTLFELKKFDEAKDVYLKNLNLQRELNNPEGEAHTFMNLGNICKAKKEYNEAEKFYLKAQKIMQKVGDIDGEGRTWFNLATLDIEQKQPQKSKLKLEKAIKFFEECSFRAGIDMARELLEKLKIEIDSKK
ncbi:MAG: tetratricopeptide repeat protein [Candidatus Cloacimonetes bacterium]|nr:tetratricopeptide repeat protein [Candidatus Cloacimonadota bacterium]